MASDINLLGTDLQPCSIAPMTGFFRDGCCKTGPDDLGSHTVCAVMTEEFLEFSQARGNDLSTPRPEYQFPGLKPGDRWCVCAARWQEAADAGAAPRVVLSATHRLAARNASESTLRIHAIDESNDGVDPTPDTKPSSNGNGVHRDNLNND